MSKKRKILLAALVLLVMMLPAMWMYSLDTIAIGGRQMICWDGGSYRAGADRLSLVQRENSADFDLTLYGEQITASLRQEGDKITVTFGTGEEITGYDRGFGHLMTETGDFLDYDPLIILVDGKLSEPLGKTALADRFFAVWKNGAEQWGPVWFPLVMALLYAFGVAHILWPEEMYFLFSRWRYSHAELSDDGLLAQKLGGWAAVIASAVLMYAPLFMS